MADHSLFSFLSYEHTGSMDSPLPYPAALRLAILSAAAALNGSPPLRSPDQVVVLNNSELLSDPEVGTAAVLGELVAAGDVTAPTEPDGPYLLTDSGRELQRYIEDLPNSKRDLTSLVRFISSICSFCVGNNAVACEQDAADSLQQHIKHLHGYNEYKDLAQAIMGEYGSAQGLTVKQVYHELDVQDSDQSEDA
ncbi:hypothetical protein BC828DRAFT_398408 [Blastocladiella britannica]|nr:hypothetical protein BC828DRAFT_398408 [Blastocladiella britannica]